MNALFEAYAKLAAQLAEPGQHAPGSLPIMDSYETYTEARRLMGAGQFEEAIGLFQQNVAASPHFKDQELLGECLMLLNRMQEAIVPLAAATTLNKGVRAPSLLAEVFLVLGQYDDAEEIADIALARHPKNRAALHVKAMVAAQRGVPLEFEEQRP